MHKVNFLKICFFLNLAEHFKKLENIIFNICFRNLNIKFRFRFSFYRTFVRFTASERDDDCY